MTVSRAAFPPSARLCEAREFRRVFAVGQKYVESGFVLIVAANGTDEARLGLALAKRRLRRAVDRNRVKRVLRESFRHARLFLPAVDVVVIARSKTGTLGNDALYAQLALVWSRIARRDWPCRHADTASDSGD